MKKLLNFVLFVFPFALFAQGMWIPLEIDDAQEKEMRNLGFKLKAEDLYHPEHASLKDAICQFGGGCTGEMISPKGLLLTNHHCGFGAIQRLSSLEKNYVDSGYWAMNRSEELPAPGITAMFVSRIQDVSALVLLGITEGMSETARQSVIDQNIEKLRRETKLAKHEEILIRPFYQGNKYYLFVTVTYRDVRLVGTPPSSIGKFGSDTDNWVWPRHTGDFSLFRVYAGKDNLPADYSPDNIPFKPRRHLPVSLKGVQEGDFTLVYGFPGRTDEYLSAEGLRQTAEVLDPARVETRDEALKVMDGYMRQDPAIKIAYIARYASIANYWKKWLGEMQGLQSKKALDIKQAYESSFTKRIEASPDMNALYGNLLPRLTQTYKDQEPYALAREYYFETLVRNNQLFGLVSGQSRWVQSYTDNGPAAFAQKITAVKTQMEGYFKDYHPEVDQAVNARMLERFARHVPDDWGSAPVKAAVARHGGYDQLATYLFKSSAFTDQEKMTTLLSKDGATVYQEIRKDPAYQLWYEVDSLYRTHVAPRYNELQNSLNLLQREYMAAQLAVFRDKRFFPDANGTLRITYGKVKPYSPRDAVKYEYQTDLDGVMEKYVPGDYEFDVPAKLIALHQNKDYGDYAQNGTVPVAFIATNHTTGGNSGSPALDARGNLIGLNFDRVWEGTMSDLHYDADICRNIMVDMRYVLFIIDKYAGAGHLIQEMTIVR
ncbi:MAG: S46 family peptidase [Saprospiraceae bacterium]|nr:S46 family peptidase [Saprospiraceae bacterium]